MGEEEVGRGARTEMWRCDEKMEGTRAGEIMDGDGVSSRKKLHKSQMHQSIFVFDRSITDCTSCTHSHSFRLENQLFHIRTFFNHFISSFLS